jgi:hypothetical protein
MTLANAIEVLESKHQAKLSMIEIEDGSGYKFNYRILGEQKNRFIDLWADEYLKQYQQVMDIVGKW